jgi:hypothetical protein
MDREEMLIATFVPMLVNLESIRNNPEEFLSGSLESTEEWIENLKNHHKVTSEEWDRVTKWTI